MAHFPDLGLHPYHGSLALIVLQQEAADLARSIESIKSCSIWEYGPVTQTHIWIYHVHVYTNSSDSTSPCQVNHLWALWLFFILDMTLNYLLHPGNDVKLYHFVLLLMLFWHSSIDTCDFCTSWLHQNSLLYLSQFRPQYDNKLFTFVPPSCITHCEHFTSFALYRLHFVLQLTGLPLARH